MTARRDLEPADTRVVVGSPLNFWLWSQESGWDLTHPAHPAAPQIQSKLCLKCSISNVAIDPTKSALVIIDMQNYSMSSALGVPHIPAVSRAQDMLLDLAIPAARKAEIQIIWLNWGLTEKELENITPSAVRVFGWKPECEVDEYTVSSCGETPTLRGPGMDLGQVILDDGTTTEAGRALMRNTWNTKLHEPLHSAYVNSQTANRPDVLLYKNRNSGLWDVSCDLSQYLANNGIRTLLFSGMNTDQCVMSTLQDAHHRGFDTILLSDACATDSPQYAQQSAEFNSCVNWGFLSSCEALAAAAMKLEGFSQHEH